MTGIIMEFQWKENIFQKITRRKHLKAWKDISNFTLIEFLIFSIILQKKAILSSILEKFFLNEGFPKFNKDKYVNGYFLDFAFDDLKVYIEVDGE